VIDLELSWHQAAATAGALAVGTVALRRSRRPRLAAASVFTQESALVLALFALWQYAGSFGLMGPGGALGRSRWIWHAERLVHLPSETWVQGLFLPHPLLIQFFNLYYDSLHFPVLITCLIWLFVRHRESYRRVRTTLVLLTGACLLIQLVPVAPPRMLPGTGLVDTAVLYHQSVYGTVAGFNADELSAMPSVHVGWAVLVAVAVITTARTRWRWLALLYPAMTTLTVVVTANHFWADGIVAASVLGLALAGQAAGRAVLARARARTGKTGLYPARPAWDDPGDNVPTGARGPNGDISSGVGESRPAPERHRSA
jgi:PAP2 superfamily